MGYRGDQDKQRAAMYRGAGLLESYQRQVQSLDGGLQELEENIDTVREVMTCSASRLCSFLTGWQVVDLPGHE